EERLLPVERPPDGTALSVRLGLLLGYPRCCVEAWATLAVPHDNAATIRASCERSRAFDPLLNNLSLGLYHHIAWFPCRYDCEASRRLAEPVAADLAARAPAPAALIARILSMP